ncbi:MAG: hypothetical protein NC098_07905 [Lachnoclostridium sp.]|nr:hypothetical protein [Lachnoclostridium sp.]
MKRSAVSRKFRTRVIEKITSAFTGYVSERLVSLAEAMMTDGFKPDVSAEDQMVKSIFEYISTEIQQAVERSRKARQRVSSKVKSEKNSHNSQKEYSDNTGFLVRNRRTGKYANLMEFRGSNGRVACITGLDGSFDPRDYELLVDPDKFPTRQLRRKAQRLVDSSYYINKIGDVMKRL